MILDDWDMLKILQTVHGPRGCKAQWGTSSGSTPAFFIAVLMHRATPSPWHKLWKTRLTIEFTFLHAHLAQEVDSGQSGNSTYTGIGLWMWSSHVICIRSVGTSQVPAQVQARQRVSETILSVCVVCMSHSVYPPFLILSRRATQRKWSLLVSERAPKTAQRVLFDRYEKMLIFKYDKLERHCKKMSASHKSQSLWQFCPARFCSSALTTSTRSS